MKTTVIVTTYNRPDALKLVLDGFASQKDLNFDLVVADDGSGNSTRQMLYETRNQWPFSISHVWHEDDGFRAAAIRNKAVKSAVGEYLIFTDGDCVPMPNFVKNHKRLAESGHFVVGHRILLSQIYTHRVLAESLQIHRLGFRGLLKQYLHGNLNKFLPIISYAKGGYLRKMRPYNWQGAMTCNLSLWRQDILSVNGFEEEYVGWGLEDSDLVIRLINFGVCRKSGRFATPTLHLWHEENDRSQIKDNQKRLDFVFEKKSTQARRGFYQN